MGPGAGVLPAVVAGPLRRRAGAGLHRPAGRRSRSGPAGGQPVVRRGRRPPPRGRPAADTGRAAAPGVGRPGDERGGDGRARDAGSGRDDPYRRQEPHRRAVAPVRTGPVRAGSRRVVGAGPGRPGDVGRRVHDPDPDGAGGDGPRHRLVRAPDGAAPRGLGAPPALVGSAGLCRGGAGPGHRPWTPGHPRTIGAGVAGRRGTGAPGAPPALGGRPGRGRRPPGTLGTHPPRPRGDQRVLGRHGRTAGGGHRDLGHRSRDRSGRASGRIVRGGRLPLTRLGRTDRRRWRSWRRSSPSRASARPGGATGWRRAAERRPRRRSGPTALAYWRPDGSSARRASRKGGPR